MHAWQRTYRVSIASIISVNSRDTSIPKVWYAMTWFGVS
jgi:hypothetical protein